MNTIADLKAIYTTLKTSDCMAVNGNKTKAKRTLKNAASFYNLTLTARPTESLRSFNGARNAFNDAFTAALREAVNAGVAAPVENYAYIGGVDAIKAPEVEVSTPEMTDNRIEIRELINAVKGAITVAAAQRRIMTSFAIVKEYNSLQVTALFNRAMQTNSGVRIEQCMDSALQIVESIDQKMDKIFQEMDELGL